VHYSFRIILCQKFQKNKREKRKFEQRASDVGNPSSSRIFVSNFSRGGSENKCTLKEEINGSSVDLFLG
jgi:hypothetical protein